MAGGADGSIGEEQILQRADAIRELRRARRLKLFTDMKLHFADSSSRDGKGHVRTNSLQSTKKMSDVEKMADSVFRTPLELALKEYVKRLEIMAQGGPPDHGKFLNPEFYDLSDKRKSKAE